MSYRNFPSVLVLGMALAAAPAFASQGYNSGSGEPVQQQPTAQPPMGQQTPPPSTQTPPAAQPPAGQPATPPAAGSPSTPPPAGAAGAAAVPGTGNGRDCIDQAYDFTINGPDDWVRATDTSSITVPGTVRCVWSPDGTTVLVAFVQKATKPTDPRKLLTSSVNALVKGLGATVPEQNVRDIGGMRGMWMVVNGKGTGAALSANGDVPTAQHWVAIPRVADVVIFLLTAPQAKFADQDQIFQQALATLKVGGIQTPEQKAAQ